MKKYLLFVFGILVFGVIGIFDMLGVSASVSDISSIIHASESNIQYSMNDSSSYIYYSDSEEPWAQSFGHYDELNVDNSLSFSGYSLPIYVKSNLDLQYYLTVDSLKFQYKLSELYWGGSDEYVSLTFHAYAKSGLDIELGAFESYQIFSNIRFSAVSQSGLNNYACYTTVNNSDTPHALVTCRMRRDDLDSFYLTFNMNNGVYEDLTPETGWFDGYYFIYLSDVINYQIDDLGAVSTDVSVVQDKVTLKFETQGRDDVVGYRYSLSSNYENVFTNEDEVILEKFPNGIYSGTVRAVYEDGTESPLSSFEVNVTSSPLPVLRYVVTYVDNDIIVNLSQSYAVMGSIIKYYYQLDNGDWIDSTYDEYTFKDIDFGSHKVCMKVQDSNGFVTTGCYNFTSKDKVEEAAEGILGFIESIIDFWNNGWTNLINAVKRIFIPDEDVLSDTLNTIMLSIEDQFGFLSYPFTWILTFLENFLTLSDSGSYLIAWPAVKVPNFDYVIIEAGSFDLATLLQDSTINAFHEIYLIFIDALILISFFNLCLNKLSQYFGGEEFTTEVLVDSDSYSYVDDLGTRQTVTSSKTRSKRRRSL